jgi:hypothetical protein
MRWSLLNADDSVVRKAPQTWERNHDLGRGPETPPIPESPPMKTGTETVMRAAGVARLGSGGRLGRLGLGG